MVVSATKPTIPAAELAVPAVEIFVSMAQIAVTTAESAVFIAKSFDIFRFPGLHLASKDYRECRGRTYMQTFATDRNAGHS